MGEEYNRRAAELYAAQAPDVDIIVTTALIPGRPAPRLITADMVAAMRPGSVIVDMAAANGGNVEGSVADEMVVSDNGVRIIGYTDLAARLPTQASQLYGTNLVNLMKLLTPGKDGELVLDFDDVVQRNMTVARDGELLWPPPAIQVTRRPRSRRRHTTRRWRRSLSHRRIHAAGMWPWGSARPSSRRSRPSHRPASSATSRSSRSRSSSATTSSATSTTPCTPR